MRAPMSLLDLKLGFRMLVKYPGLTLVGGLAIAFPIWVGAGAFEIVTQLSNPNLALEDGDRIVGIRQRNIAESDLEAASLHDFATWRGELESVEDLGAFRTVERNLITAEGRGEPVQVAQMSASGFRVAGGPPLLGRTLVEADGREGAPPVVVVGYEIWQSRFGGDADVVGRMVRLGRSEATVVGVMPEGFAFPVNHRIWMPLRLNALEYDWGEAPTVTVFGRLAPGATLEAAGAELTAIGQRMAADHPDSHEHMRPTVLPYAEAILPIPDVWEVRTSMYSLQGMGILLIILMCGNVALLMFARAASRENEIAVRNALGASRRRVIGQLFAEALVLSTVAAVVGLAAVNWGLEWWSTAMLPELLGDWRLPFWFHASLSPGTVLYAGVLAVLGALITGVVPALKATRGVGARLRRASAGGGGFRFGGVWTAVIVAQVAITVFVPVFAYVVQRDVNRLRSADVKFAEDEYLTVRLELDRQTPGGVSADDSPMAFLARSRAMFRELERRLAEEPGILGVTFANRLPRMYHPYRLVELDEGGAAPLDPRWPAYRVSSAAVAPGYFEVLGAPILAGRGFRPGDARAEPGTAPGGGPGVVIVNESFVELVLGGRNPIGRHVRYTHLERSDAFSPEDPTPWFEIVGVVPDMGMNLGVSATDDPKVAGFYHPVTTGAARPVHMAVHVRGDPEAFGPRLRRLAAAADPSLRLYDITPMDELSQGVLKVLNFWRGLMALVIGIVLLLSLAGIYAVMSFTVTQRTREIAIRVALGADRRRLILTTLRRPLTQVALGIAAGAVLLLASAGGIPSWESLVVILVCVGMMVTAGMLACIVPTRRALRIEPTEALKAE